jgi:hypothetical protein
MAGLGRSTMWLADRPITQSRINKENIKERKRKDKEK